MASATSLLLLLLLPFLDTATSASPLHYPHSLRIAVDPPKQEPPEIPAARLSLILTNLGFKKLAMAIPSTLGSDLFTSPWSSPFTIFAPSDDSIYSCGVSCRPVRLLLEHTVPGVFPFRHLSKIAVGTKLETASPNRCLTVTSTAANFTTVKIFVEGVEITRPDLFNNGMIVIHGIQGFIAPLTAFSCLSAATRSPFGAPTGSAETSTASLMIHDAVVRLHAGGYGVLALAMRIKSPELVGLQNMTVFALDDLSIFSGGHAYVKEMQFHMVPNQLLMHADLEKLPEGTMLRTLVGGQPLVVTHSALSDPFSSGVRINYVPIENPDVVFNSNIVVHSLSHPFPHLYLVDRAKEESSAAAVSACGPHGGAGDCTAAPTPAPTAAAPAYVPVNLHLVHEGL